MTRRGMCFIDLLGVGYRRLFQAIWNGKVIMPRTLNEAKYPIRHNEILDAALKPVKTRGYKQQTIQNILDGHFLHKALYDYD